MNVKFREWPLRQALQPAAVSYSSRPDVLMTRYAHDQEWMMERACAAVLCNIDDDVHEIILKCVLKYMMVSLTVHQYVSETYWSTSWMRASILEPWAHEHGRPSENLWADIDLATCE